MMQQETRIREVPIFLKRKANIEQTVVLIKPDEIEAGRAGEIFSRIAQFCENHQLNLESKTMILDRPTLERHYRGKGYSDQQRIGKKLVKILREHEIYFESEQVATDNLFTAHVEGYMDKPAIAFRITGENAISLINAFKGDTDSSKAPKNTLRGEFSLGIPMHEYLRGTMRPIRNIVHASETQEEATFDLKTFWG